MPCRFLPVLGRRVPRTGRIPGQKGKREAPASPRLFERQLVEGKYEHPCGLSRCRLADAGRRDLHGVMRPGWLRALPKSHRDGRLWRGAEVSKYAPRFRLLRYTGPFRLASGTSKMTRNRPIAFSPARIIRPAAQFDEDAIWRVIEPVFRAGETYPLPRDISRLPIGARRATRCSSRRSEDGS
jgi:hypothetical protein